MASSTLLSIVLPLVLKNSGLTNHGLQNYVLDLFSFYSTVKDVWVESLATWKIPKLRDHNDFQDLISNDHCEEQMDVLSSNLLQCLHPHYFFAVDHS